jgi:protocatechuate 3,4-dioxygenase alpha subunit
MSSYLLTGSQTVGPFFEPCLLRDGACFNVLTQPETSGERIRIVGCVFDGEKAPVPDALIEIWQANAAGRYQHSADQSAAPLDTTFLGYGRTGTQADGSYWFETIKPGPVPFSEQQMQAPHICYTIFARGLLNHLITRLYFEDEPATLEDPVLLCVPEERRATLVAGREASEGIPTYRLDIVLQGEGETAFFNL